MPDYIDYHEFKVKSYDLWDLYLHTKQDPLGRCYLLSKRDLPNIIGMNENEWAELPSIISEWFNALKSLYQADWPSALCYGNMLSKGLRWHLIPKYATERKFYGITFKENYKPNGIHEQKEISLDILKQIKQDIASKLKQSSKQSS
jgi:diadenosine tetraphosphate (Ap4A) HIT family hydrolase